MGKDKKADKKTGKKKANDRSPVIAENQNQAHNTQMESLGPNTNR